MAKRSTASNPPLGTNPLSALWLREHKLWSESGRFSRGKKYWRDRRIRELGFYSSDLRIEGRVEGSYYNDYWVSYHIEPFSEIEQQKVIEMFKTHPSWLVSLQHQVVPDELVPYCEQVGISLYPSVMGVDCTCPDLGNPCKHGVAVALGVVSALDDDPIELFHLKGMNLAELFPQVNAKPAVSSTLEAILEHDYTPAAHPFDSMEEALQAEVPDLSESLLKAYVDVANTPYLNGNTLKSLYTVTKLTLDYDNELATAEINTIPWRSPNLVMYPTLELSPYEYNVHLMSRTKRGRSPKHRVQRADEIWDTILHLSGSVCETDQKLRLWKQALLLARRLVQSGAMYPVAYQKGENGENRSVLWLPATMNETVARQIATLQAEVEQQREDWKRFLPHASYERQLVGTSARFLIGDTERNEALMLVSEALRWLIARAMRSVDAFKRDPVCKVLFVNESSLGLSPSYVEACDRFFSPYSLANLKRPYELVVTVRRRDHDTVGVSLGIRMKGEAVQATGTELSPETIADEPEAPEEETFVNYQDVLTRPEYENIRYDVVGLAQRLAPFSPVVEHIVKNDGKTYALEKVELAQFVFEQIPSLVLFGIRVRLPKSLQRLLRPQLYSDFSIQGDASVLSRSAVLDFNWRVALGDKEMSSEEFLKLCRHAGGIVAWGDDFIYLEPEAIARMRVALERPRQVGRLAAIAAAQTGEYNGFPAEVSQNILKELERLNQVETVSLPAGLNAHLRPYQERGFAWLHKNTTLGLGSLIADDMGLGKTMQVIALLLKLKEEGKTQGPHLLIVPTTLIANWEHELSKFAPSLRFRIYHGSDRVLDTDTDIVITSYGTARMDIERLAKFTWEMVILDEAQAVKNSTTGVSQSLKQLKARGSFIGMTGTPVENRLMEYWSIFSLVEPGLLGSQSHFQEMYVVPIERNHDPEVLERFKQLTAPFMLRRVKTDKNIIADLPDKFMVDRFVSLNKQQAALYQATLDRELEAMQKAKETENKGQQRVRLLALMTKLKQICNSVSQFKNTEQKRPVPDSGKGEVLMDILAEAQENQQKVLIFTQYVQMGERLQNWIEAATGVRPDFLNGSVPVKKRAEMVKTFQTDEAAPVMIVSLKAGGTGLNLTKATIVVHYDLWWNPAVENQATDRAYRIGQTRDVTVYRLITRGTFEERINDLLNEKRALADMTVSVGESWIGDLSQEQLADLFKLEV